MQYKKIMMLAILLLSLFVVSAVSAADNATSDVLSVNETTEEVVSVDDDNQVILEETNVGTFTDLANEIANAKGTLNLNRNYAYSNGDDRDYREGIIIDKSITINGNGYTINGANYNVVIDIYGHKTNAYAKIFNVNASNVVLKNINFENTFSLSGESAINWNGDNGKMSGCSFTYSFSYGDGAAVCWKGDNGMISDCSFANSFSENGGSVSWKGLNGELSGCSFVESSAVSGHGGAIHWSGDMGKVSGCSFVDCSASRYGGALQWEGSNGTVSDCSFERSSAKSDGGAISWERPYGIVENCIFVNSKSGGDGGAIFWYSRHGRLTDCVFIESSSVGDGGAIKWEGFNGTLQNCLFVNSTTDGNGGAVDWSPNYGNLSFVSNCSFVNSRSIFNGGALYWKSETGTLSDCSFTNSHSGAYGGALYWEVLNGTVINCNFMGSTAYNGGAVHWNGVMGYIALSSFKNNAAEDAGGGIYVVGIPLFGLIDPIFEGNVAQNGSDWFSESGTIEIIHSTILSAPNVSTTVGTSKNLVVALTDFNKNALAGEEISVVLNNVRYNLNTNSKGKASLAIPTNLDPKTYVATITYAGNEEYAPSTASANVVVNKIGTVVSAVYDANNNEIVATLTNANTGKAISSANIKLNLNGATATVKTNSKGQAKFSTVGLSSGTAKISYAGNSKYKSTSTSITITVKSDIIISAVYDSENNELVATLTNGDTGKAVSSATVQVNINGETTTAKTDTKGKATISTVGLPLGTNTATISYAGNSKYNPASTSISFDVKTKVIVTDVYAYSDRIVAKLTNGATGKTIANANMIVEINGIKYNAKSDNKGQLTFDTTGLNLPSAYDLTISYRGNDRYTASSATVAVDLNKANMMITTNYHADKQKMVATLKNSKTGKVVSNANMVIELNGVKTTYKSNDQGKITLPTAGFAPGTYVGTVTYPGNARYNSISAVFKVDI